MFQSWRVQLREAEEAFRAGRLDEADRLLRQGQLRQYLPGKRLSAKVAQHIACRGRQRVLDGESSAGWRDLDAAASLGGGAGEVSSIRQEVIGYVLREAEGLIAATETPKALSRLESLEKHGVGNGQVRTLKEVAGRLQSAGHLSERGRFEDAEVHLARAFALRPDLAPIEDLLGACREKQKRARKFTERLHQALSDEKWSETLALANELLEMAPNSPLAHDARRRAWLEIGAPAPGSKQNVATPVRLPAATDERTGGSQDSLKETSGKSPKQRFLLWVDGVGGYLVCLDGEVTIGQAVPGTRVDVPIQGDLSREHARIRREDGYLIEPLGRVRIDGKEIQDTSLLSDGDEIELGDGVRLRFRQPHALSATARLEIVSRHRTAPSADGVLLMAESCVMGPKWQNHVICRDWSSDVVLYRRDGDLYCRAAEAIEIDDHFCEGQGKVSPGTHIDGSDFSLSLESIA